MGKLNRILEKRVNIGGFIPKVHGGTTLEEIIAWLKQIDIVHTLKRDDTHSILIQQLVGYPIREMVVDPCLSK